MAARIETDRLVLIPLDTSQLDNFHRVWSNPEATFWSLRGCVKELSKSREMLQRTLEASDPPVRYDWVAVLRQDEQSCIGLLSMWLKHEQEPGTVEDGQTWIIAYMLLPEYWGSGYATEATKGMIEGMAPTIRPCTVQAYINRANPPSLKVAEKLGFQVAEKIYRPQEPRVFVGGEWREYDVWRLTRKI